MGVICSFAPSGLGWCQSLRDFRDLTPESPIAQQLLSEVPADSRTRRPTRVDLREYLPAVSDQLNLNASPAHASAALVEYFVRRARGRTVQLSKLFLYQTARRLLRVEGDCHTDLRSALKALQCFGVPPEEFWPYDVAKVNCPPDAFLYSFGGEYRAVRYVRLDVRNSYGAKTLDIVRAFVAAGFPVVFGFPVPTSVTRDCDIPYRPAYDSIHGGQAVLCVGYDDRRLVSTRGALLIRNSWGPEWGDAGYGWLPYRYVEEQLASDFWTLLHAEWLASGEFSRPPL